GDDGPARAQVDAHAQQRIDERQAVRTALFARPGYRYDVRHVGAQFHIYGFGGDGLHRPGHFVGAFGYRPETHSAVLHVGTADVHLDDAHLLLRIDFLATVG